MNDAWQRFYNRLIQAGWMGDFIALMNYEAMMRSRQAAQVGQPDDIRRDALADVRFCLCRADEAAEALKAVKGNANPDAAGGFQKGGTAPA